jgi:predicted DNA-binding transcriptional regulator AlpA
MGQAQNTPAVPLNHLPDSALIKLPTYMSLVAMSKAAVYKAARDGRGPAPVKLGVRSSAFRLGDVRRFLANPCGYRTANDGSAS